MGVEGEPPLFSDLLLPNTKDWMAQPSYIYLHCCAARILTARTPTGQAPRYMVGVGQERACKRTVAAGKDRFEAGNRSKIERRYRGLESDGVCVKRWGWTGR